jgi:hypothetical protein
MLALLPFPILLTILQPTVAEIVSSLQDNSENCSCYVVNSGESSTPTYFQYHRFWDFRQIAAETRNSYVSTPPRVNDTQDSGDEPVWNPEFFDTQAWNADWAVMNWSKNATDEFPVRMVNSLANVYLQQDDEDDESYLTLRTTRLDDFQSAAEVENVQKNMLHASMRIYGRVRGAKGAVAGFFTFADDDNETDIEILTSDSKNTIRYTNQPSLTPSGDQVQQASISTTSLPSWTDWRTHRIDWLPKDSYWYLDGEQTAHNTYSVPRRPSGLVLNMWSDGGEWSGEMKVGDSAEFQIMWVEMVFNTSGPVEGVQNYLEKRKKKSKRCEVVCKIDNVDELGTPEVVSVHRSVAAGMGVSWAVLGLVGLGTAFWVGL